MTDLTPEVLDQLEALAQAATYPEDGDHGEWQIEERRLLFGILRNYGTTRGGQVWHSYVIRDLRTSTDATYIAAADPATILALIAEVRRLRADWLREATSRDELLAKVERLREACRTPGIDDWGVEYLYVSAILRILDGGDH